MSIDSKYPRSVNGLQCIDNCYENSYVVNPITYQLHYVTDCACPTSTPNKNGKFIDKCENKYCVMENNVSNVIQDVEHESTFFLKFCYNINSFKNAIEWYYKNINKLYWTKERIINYSLCSYGIGDIDDDVVSFFIYYYTDNDIFKNAMREFKIHDYNKILDKELIYNCLIKYATLYNNKFLDMENPIINILNYFISYVKDGIHKLSISR
jgi:hypothetical protein